MGGSVSELRPRRQQLLPVNLADRALICFDRIIEKKSAFWTHFLQSIEETLLNTNQPCSRQQQMNPTLTDTKFEPENARSGKRIIDVDKTVETKQGSKKWKEQEQPLEVERGLGAQSEPHRGCGIFYNGDTRSPATLGQGGLLTP